MTPAARTYQNHHLDSTRWRWFERRPQDIVISTSYKAGTTLMQTIVANLIFTDRKIPGPVTKVSPWLDFRVDPLELVLADLDAQTHRRFIKSHLPLDGLPFWDDVRYVYVGRDPRDVFASLLNHWGGHTEAFFDRINSTPGRVGARFPAYAGDPKAAWRDWIARGWFEWERDGYPYWSHLHHFATWWAAKDRPNVRLIHFADLLADLEGQMRAIAEFLETPVDAASWPDVVARCTFDAVKANPERVVGDMSRSFRGGAQRFINKGTNGRWRSLLDEEDLTLYAQTMASTLDDDARHWLEEGSL